MLRPIKEVITILKKLPKDALCYAYEGEVTGIVVRDKDDKKQIAFIHASEWDNKREGDEYYE